MADVDSIESKIYVVRGQRVMLDEDLAQLFGVPVKRLNEQVRRNHERFPPDFLFQLTFEEFRQVKDMRSQIATAYRRNRRHHPFAFTEHGALMAANVVNSSIAVAASIAIVRAFVQLRSIASEDKETLRKLNELDRKYARHDAELRVVFNTLRKLMEPPGRGAKRKIGFEAE